MSKRQVLSYFEVLDNRFDQSSVVSNKESNGQEISEIPKVLTQDTDAYAARTISAAFTSSVNTVTNVRTITEALNQINIVKGMLNKVDMLVQAYLTFPVTRASAERSFSSLRKIKTYLRSSMTGKHLNNLFILYVHKVITDSLI